MPPDGAGDDLYRALHNLLHGSHPLTRLQAWHEIRSIVEAVFDAGELEGIDAARSANASMERIGRAIDRTGQGAGKRFRRLRDRLQ